MRVTRQVDRARGKEKRRGDAPRVLDVMHERLVAEPHAARHKRRWLERRGRARWRLWRSGRHRWRRWREWHRGWALPTPRVLVEVARRAQNWIAIADTSLAFVARRGSSVAALEEASAASGDDDGAIVRAAERVAFWRRRSARHRLITRPAAVREHLTDQRDRTRVTRRHLVALWRTPRFRCRRGDEEN